MVKIDGVSYASVRAACDQHHVNINTYYKRIRSGMSEHDALQSINYHSVRPTYAKSMSIDGVSYSTTEEACKAFGIKKRSFYNRVESGYSVEDALKLKVKGKIKEEVMGKSFPSRKAAMRYFGVCSTTVYSIMKKQRLSFADAVSVAVSRL